ncbi:MAG: AMP-binding protein [Pseudomonadota bacterium]
MTLPASVGAKFAELAVAAPDRAFLRSSGGASFSRGDMDRLARLMAGRLWEAGARPGDRVTAVVEKSAEAFALYVACQYGGFVYHPANIGYTDQELAYLVEDAAPKVIVCDPARQDAFEGAAAVMTLDSAGRGPIAETSGVAPDLSYEPASDDWAALLYTSGTTGKPKGAMLTHGNLLSNAETLIDAWRITDQDRLLHVLPIFHVHGLFVAGNTALCAGYEMFFEQKFDLDTAFTLLPEATLFMGVPTHYGRLMSDPRLNKDATSAMRLFVSGSAPLDAVASDTFYDKTGLRVLERYGMTETVMLTSNPYEGDRVAGSVGPALPGVELRLRKDDGALAETGETGVVEVRGPNVCKGYFNLPEKTKEAFTDDGFFVTGDIGVMDERGYVTLQGRLSDMIISGGYNVYPREVENALLEQPAILEAAVFGVPHPDFGEGVVAVAVADGAAPDEADILAGVKGVIAAYKSPKRVFMREELPKNAMGKIDRKVLRAEFNDLFSK